MSTQTVTAVYDNLHRCQPWCEREGLAPLKKHSSLAEWKEAFDVVGLPESMVIFLFAAPPAEPGLSTHFRRRRAPAEDNQKTRVSSGGGVPQHLKLSIGH